MPKKMAVLAAVLAAVVSMPTPALAQDEVPACEIQDACLDTPEEQQIANGEEDIPSVSGIGCESLPADQEMSNLVPDPECDEVDQSLEDFPGSDGSQEVNSAGNLQSASAAQYGISPVCATCAQDVLTAAKEAITKGGSDGGTSPEETFGAALDAARDTGGTREAAASEETGTPVEDTAAYQAAFEAAKEAGADDETAREAAEQAVADLRSDEATSSAGRSATSKANKASKVLKGGGTAAAEGKKSRKDRASRSDDGKGKARNDGASEEETTNEEVVTSGDNGGAGGGDTPSTPTGSGAPLLLGGVALLSVGGYAGLRLARSWSSTHVGRRLLRN